MKTITLILLAFPAFAGELYQHINSGPLDVYVDDYSVQEPALPAPVAESHYVKVSIGTTDPDASIVVVNLRVLLTDGSTTPIRFVLEMDGPRTEARREVPGKPVKVTLLYVTRFRSQPTDQIIKPEVRP